MTPLFHLIKELLKKNVKVTLSSDDPALFGIGLHHEWERAITEIGLSKKDLLYMDKIARDTSFTLKKF